MTHSTLTHYHSPGCSSLCVRIALLEAGLAFDAEPVDLFQKRLSDGSSFERVSPNGLLPALRLEDGQVLTEALAILQFVADQQPGSRLAPANGTMDRYRLQELLSFISAELYARARTVGRAPEPFKSATSAELGQRLGYLERLLADGRAFLMGEQFTVADAYLVTLLCLFEFHAKVVSVEIPVPPAVQAYGVRLRSRPAVQAALRAEGLLS